MFEIPNQSFQIPKDLISSIYKMKMASRKDPRKSMRKNNNYECKIKKCKGEEEKTKQDLVKRRSNLYDRYSVESQVERRHRTTSSSNADKARPTSLTINAIQEICMVDIKTQLQDLTKRINKLIETTETRLSEIENKLNQPP